MNSISYSHCLSIFILIIQYVISHPNCVEPINGSLFPPKLDHPLEFCTEYSNDIDGACCTIDTEGIYAGNVVPTILDKADPCFEYIRKLYCAYCAPYAGHFFESEGQVVSRDSTWMCPEFCQRFWDACSQANLNASGPASVNQKIRVPGLEGSSGVTNLQSLFASREDYCKIYSTDNPVSCYSDDLADKKLKLDGPGVPYKTIRAFPNLDLMSIPHKEDLTPHVTHMIGFNDGTDRICVLFQHGIVIAFDNRPDVNQYDLLLDIQSDVFYDGGGGSEYGLVGVAFHPDYLNNGWIYLKHSHLEHTNRLIRYTFPPGSKTIDQSTMLVILSYDYTGSMHHGGQPEFANDGYLYYPTGDGVNYGENFVEYSPATDPTSLLGKILRIDVSQSSEAEPYKVPQDNPFIGKDNWRPEIYAYGFRNPWRFSYDKVKDRFWIGHVGQFSFESIIVLEKGKFHGWHKREGFNCYYPRMSLYGNPFIDCATEGEVLPIIEFPHVYSPDFCEIQSEPPHCRFNIQGSAVIGGWVYRGNKNPSLQGFYLFSNFEPASAAKLYMVRHNEDDPKEIISIFRIDLVNDQISDFRIPTLGSDANGEIFIVNYDNPNEIWTLEQDPVLPPTIPSPIESPPTQPPPIKPPPIKPPPIKPPPSVGSPKSDAKNKIKPSNTILNYLILFMFVLFQN